MPSEIFRRFNRFIADGLVSGRFTANQVLYVTSDGSEFSGAIEVLPLVVAMELSVRTVPDTEVAACEERLVSLMKADPLPFGPLPSSVFRSYNRWLAERLAASLFANNSGTLSTFYCTIGGPEVTDARNVLGARMRSQRVVTIPDHEVEEYEQRMVRTMATTGVNEPPPGAGECS